MRGLLLLLLLLLGCDRTKIGETRTIFFANDAVASVVEAVDGDRVVRTVKLDDEVIVSDVRVDKDGFVVSADYLRPGKRHLRYARGQIVDDSGHSLTVSTPVVLVDLLHRLRTTRTTRATLLDLSSAEALEVTVSRKGPEIVVVAADGSVVARAIPEGQRAGPGVFVEGDIAANVAASPVVVAVPGLKSLKGKRLGGEAARLTPPSTLAPSPADSQPGLFIESDDAAVKAFAGVCGGAFDDARRIGEAVHGLVDPKKTDQPPSATQMLAHGGDCDGAAALVAAALRACGHPARPVVGYRLKDKGTEAARLVPHAVVEVYAGSSWTRVDATVPAIANTDDDDFLAIAVGLGGALSMGRILGRVDAGDVVSR